MHIRKVRRLLASVLAVAALVAVIPSAAQAGGYWTAFKDEYVAPGWWQKAFSPSGNGRIAGMQIISLSGNIGGYCLYLNGNRADHVNCNVTGIGAYQSQVASNFGGLRPGQGWNIGWIVNNTGATQLFRWSAYIMTS